MALEIGQHVGEYEILSLLGAGGMGQVYSARNIISGRVEAMKVLLPDFAAETELATRFTAEIRTLAGLDHPNITQLRTAFQFENKLVMIMELVEGATLEKLGAAGPLRVGDALNYSTQVLAALSYAHSKGVTHRDIKPANLMITSHGLVKLMDFGIAKSTTDPQLTRPGTTIGSIYYMSPEQVRGGTVDARSDIYSFGVTLYQMITGRCPFQGENAYNILDAQITQVPIPPAQINPSVPPKLNQIVLQAMAKVPAERFQSAEEFRAALSDIHGLGNEPTRSRAFAAVPDVRDTAAPGESPRPHKSQRGLWLGLGAAAAIIAMIAATTLLPRMLATHASQKNTAAVTDAPIPAQSNGNGNEASASPPVAGSPAASTPPTIEPSKGTLRQVTVPAPSTARVAASHPQPAQEANQAMPPQGPAASMPAGPSRQEIDQTRTRMIQLDSRAEAARSSIEQLRSQQQAQGLGLRGDIAASLSRMNAYLNEANRALNESDLQAADANMDRAEKELSTLEAFLGR